MADPARFELTTSAFGGQRSGVFHSRHYLKGGYIDPADKAHWKVGNINGDAPRGDHGGSTIVYLSGPRVGQWHDWSGGGSHGDLLDILRARCGKDCIKKAKAFLGWSDDKPHDPPAASVPAETAQQKTDRYQQQARKMFASAAQLDGTPAERYLRGRGIDLDPWPAVFRFTERARFKPAEELDEKGKPKVKKYVPALLCRVDDADGMLAGIQRVFLDPANPAKKVDMPAHAKKSLGPIKGGAIRLTHPNSILGICEGPEKGAGLLMMALANGWFEDWPLGLWAMPGSSTMPLLQLPEAVEEVWIFADRDRRTSRGTRPGSRRRRRLRPPSGRPAGGSRSCSRPRSTRIGTT
ncbi:MAG: hypothetical protein AB7S71_11030 [Dongiaceae bacterium]